MALTIIPAGSSTFTASKDYEKELARLDAIALDPQKIFPIDLDNDEIPQGTVLNVGGVIMKAVTAESITGTASAYVKIDHTTRTASYVSSLSGVTWNSAYNGYYDSSDDLYLFDEATAYFNGAITEIHQSYASIKRKVFEEVGVIYPQWTIALQRGNTMTFAAGYATARLAGLTIDRIAFYDASSAQELSTYDISTLIWTKIGNSLAIPSIGTMTRLNDTTIAAEYISGGVHTLRTYEFDGTDWSQVGNSYSLSTNTHQITSIGNNLIAIFELGPDELSTLSWDGTDWSSVGSALNIPIGSGAPSITKLNDNAIAFIHNTEAILKKYLWNGSSWSLAGTGLAITGINTPTISGFNDTDIAYYDYGNGELRTYRFLDDVWNRIGYGAYFSTSGAVITNLGRADIAIWVPSTRELNAYHYLNELKVF